MHANLALNPPASPRILRMSVFAPLVFLVAALCGAQMLAEQAPATAAPHRTSHLRKKAVAAHAKHAAAQADSAPQAAKVPATPPVPEMPLWPANEKAVQAAVTWDSHGLRIEAANSSLRQILRDIAAATGARVSGLGTDERVFGTYGPGPAHDVLSQLLQGSGYNILMTGDQGQGTPREILLTSRLGGGGAVAGAGSASDSDEDDDDDAEEQPETPPSQRPGLGAQRRTPLQMQQEMEQRQQQMRERQQQGQPPNEPPE
jgi:hypothetical protein